MPSLASIWQHRALRAGAALIGVGLCALGVMQLALRERQPPERCPDGMTRAGERCCGRGQALESAACGGKAESCSSAQDLRDDGACVARSGVVAVPGGELFIGAADWDGASGGERFPRVTVASFRLDVSEVTLARYRGCAGCEPLTGEPGLPVTNVTAEAAERFCRGQRGRLPTAAQWVWAAAGPSARRYPWGNAGLVCRRAAFGLVRGPCASSGSPELAGSRPDGASPDGVLDLAGNVAEWTREPDGSYAARGGSFLSASAAELKTWAVEPGHEKALHIGFRCAYPP